MGTCRDKKNAKPNINAVVAGASLDAFIPTISYAKDVEIIAKLNYKRLTK